MRSLVNLSFQNLNKPPAFHSPGELKGSESLGASACCQTDLLIARGERELMPGVKRNAEILQSIKQRSRIY